MIDPDQELRDIAAAFRNLLAEADRLADDHSPNAIFWRAWRAAMADLPRARAWKARAIGLNPAPLHNAIALGGMVPLQWEDRWHIAVALPQPRPVEGYLQQVDDLLLINPATGKAQILGDVGATHVAPAAGDRVTVHTDAKAWARAVALDRLEWYNTRRDRVRALKVEPTWLGYPHAALLLAAPTRVPWSDFNATVLDVPAEMRVDVRRAMMAQARLPRVEGRA